MLVEIKAVGVLLYKVLIRILFKFPTHFFIRFILFFNISLLSLIGFGANCPIVSFILLWCLLPLLLFLVFVGLFICYDGWILVYFLLFIFFFLGLNNIENLN